MLSVVRLQFSRGESQFEPEAQLANIAPFCDLYEFRKPLDERVHHNNDACATALKIPASQRKADTCDYPLCKECQRCNAERC
jgi:hypothetical protein